MLVVPRAQSGIQSEGIGNIRLTSLLTKNVERVQQKTTIKMRNSVENQNRIDEMSMRYHYRAAQISEATKRYLQSIQRNR